MFDLDAYLSRIGLSRGPSLADLHVAHTTTIPFAGFDSLMGIAPWLDPEELIEKRRVGAEPRAPPITAC